MKPRKPPTDAPHPQTPPGTKAAVAGGFDVGRVLEVAGSIHPVPDLFSETAKTAATPTPPAAKHVEQLESLSRQLRAINERVQTLVDDSDAMPAAAAATTTTTTVVAPSSQDYDAQLFRLVDADEELERSTVSFDTRAIVEDSRDKVKVLIVDFDKLCMDRESVLQSLRRWFDENQGRGDILAEEEREAESTAPPPSAEMEALLLSVNEARERLSHLHADVVSGLRGSAASSGARDTAPISAEALLEEREKHETAVRKLGDELSAVAGRLQMAEGRCSALQKLVERQQAELRVCHTQHVQGGGGGAGSIELAQQLAQAKEREMELKARAESLAAKLAQMESELGKHIAATQSRTKGEQATAKELERVEAELVRQKAASDAEIAWLREHVAELESRAARPETTSKTAARSSATTAAVDVGQQLQELTARHQRHLEQAIGRLSQALANKDQADFVRIAQETFSQRMDAQREEFRLALEEAASTSAAERESHARALSAARRGADAKMAEARRATEEERQKEAEQLEAEMAAAQAKGQAEVHALMENIERQRNEARDQLAEMRIEVDRLQDELSAAERRNAAAALRAAPVVVNNTEELQSLRSELAEERTAKESALQEVRELKEILQSREQKIAALGRLEAAVTRAEEDLERASTDPARAGQLQDLRAEVAAKTQELQNGIARHMPELATEEAAQVDAAVEEEEEAGAGAANGEPRKPAAESNVSASDATSAGQQRQQEEKKSETARRLEEELDMVRAEGGRPQSTRSRQRPQSSSSSSSNSGGTASARLSVSAAPGTRRSPLAFAEPSTSRQEDANRLQRERISELSAANEALTKRVKQLESRLKAVTLAMAKLKAAPAPVIVPGASPSAAATPPPGELQPQIAGMSLEELEEDMVEIDAKHKLSRVLELRKQNIEMQHKIAMLTAEASATHDLVNSLEAKKAHLEGLITSLEVQLSTATTLQPTTKQASQQQQLLQQQHQQEEHEKSEYVATLESQIARLEKELEEALRQSREELEAELEKVRKEGQAKLKAATAAHEAARSELEARNAQLNDAVRGKISDGDLAAALSQDARFQLENLRLQLAQREETLREEASKAATDAAALEEKRAREAMEAAKQAQGFLEREASRYRALANEEAAHLGQLPAGGIALPKSIEETLRGYERLVKRRQEVAKAAKEAFDDKLAVQRNETAAARRELGIARERVLEQERSLLAVRTDIAKRAFAHGMSISEIQARLGESEANERFLAEQRMRLQRALDEIRTKLSGHDMVVSALEARASEQDAAVADLRKRVEQKAALDRLRASSATAGSSQQQRRRSLLQQQQQHPLSLLDAAREHGAMSPRAVRAYDEGDSGPVVRALMNVVESRLDPAGRARRDAIIQSIEVSGKALSVVPPSHTAQQQQQQQVTAITAEGPSYRARCIAVNLAKLRERVRMQLVRKRISDASQQPAAVPPATQAFLSRMESRCKKTLKKWESQRQTLLAARRKQLIRVLESISTIPVSTAAEDTEDDSNPTAATVEEPEPAATAPTPEPAAPTRRKAPAEAAAPLEEAEEQGLPAITGVGVLARQRQVGGPGTLTRATKGTAQQQQLQSTLEPTAGGAPLPAIEGRTYGAGSAASSTTATSTAVAFEAHTAARGSRAMQAMTVPASAPAAAFRLPAAFGGQQPDLVLRARDRQIPTLPPQPSSSPPPKP